jgi:hypothetical protein
MEEEERNERTSKVNKSEKSSMAVIISFLISEICKDILDFVNPRSWPEDITNDIRNQDSRQNDFQSSQDIVFVELRNLNAPWDELAKVVVPSRTRFTEITMHANEHAVLNAGFPSLCLA